MVARDMDAAIDEARRRGCEPFIFKVHVGDRRFALRPAPTAARKGVPIDETEQASHLLCEGAVKIPIEGEW